MIKTKYFEKYPFVEPPSPLSPLLLCLEERYRRGRVLLLLLQVLFLPFTKMDALEQLCVDVHPLRRLEDAALQGNRLEIRRALDDGATVSFWLLEE